MVGSGHAASEYEEKKVGEKTRHGSYVGANDSTRRKGPCPKLPRFHNGPGDSGPWAVETDGRGADAESRERYGRAYRASWLGSAASWRTKQGDGHRPDVESSGDARLSISAMAGVPRSSGCGLCLRRRVKCDEARPACANCSKYGQACPAYEKPIKFVAGKHAICPRRSRQQRPQVPLGNQCQDGAVGPEAGPSRGGDDRLSPLTLASAGPPSCRP